MDKSLHAIQKLRFKSKMNKAIIMNHTTNLCAIKKSHVTIKKNKRIHNLYLMQPNGIN